MLVSMQRLSPLDASFLHLERSIQQLNVGSALVFEGPPPTPGEFSAAIEALLPAFPRYRQHVRRVPLDLALPVWVDDPGFRLGDHVGHRVLPSPGTDVALRELAVRLISQPLDLDRPLWRSWLVTGLDGGRFAVVNTNHHAMIDGASGTDILSVLLATSAEAPIPVGAGTWEPGPGPTGARLTLGALVELGSSPVRGIRRLAGAMLPRALPRSVAGMVGMVRYGQQLSHVERGLNGHIGPRRDWGWVRADLDAVKAVKNRHGGTVNDVVLAATAGGFRALLLARGQEVDGRTVRTMVPVSMRHADEHGMLGNRVAAVFADLPVGVEDPLERLRAVTAQLKSLKDGGTALGVDALLGAADLLPGNLFALGVKLWAHSPQRIFSTVTTNVPGPQTPRYLLGRRMTDMYPYIPLGADLRITIGIASYAGGLAWGITGDHDSVPDLPVLTDGIERSIDELISLSNPSPRSTRTEVRHA
jgi:WS/DGAT/MGAT family acyltransferase